ncbi:MAG TPA: hypothetical protein VN753_17380 [Terracidiphilus sp.]|jgi:hypothetical protein|nr:hypothetical protein [Terracidiphilus sp.]
MQSMFRKVVMAAAVGVFATLAASTANAENKVNVPFSFQVAGKTLPAGNYNISHDSTGSFVTLRNVNATQSFTWLLTPGLPDGASKKIALRFDDRNGGHVLQSVQFNSMITPRLDDAKKIASDRDPNGQ